MHRSPFEHLDLSQPMRDIFGRMVRAGWIKDQHGILSDGQACTFWAQLTSLGIHRMAELNTCLKAAYPPSFVKHIKQGVPRDCEALFEQWRGELDFSRIANAFSRAAPVIAELHPPPLGPAECTAVIHLALALPNALKASEGG